MSDRDDTFELYDLRVEVVATDRPMVCGHRAGDWLELRGENLTLPAGQPFSIYALAALLPILPAKQRLTHPHDWMTTDTDIACPDPNCGARFRITRIGTRTFRHSDVTAVPLPPRLMTWRCPASQLAPGYTVSRLLKGGWQLAGGHGPVDAAAALDDMDRFVDAGITTFDCADIYTGVEALIGEWLKRRRARGAAVPVQVHTKYVPDLDRLPTHSRADVVRGVDRSLARLGVDRLDLVQLHWWDYDVPGYVDAAAWLDELRRAGKIRHIGLTNFDQQRLEEIVAAGIPVVSHQVQYSVLDRRPANGDRRTMRAQRHRPSLLRRAGRRVSFRSLPGRRRSRPAAREPIAREVPADHRRVRRMGPLPGDAGGARRWLRRATASGSARWRSAGCSINPACRASSWARATRDISTRPMQACHARARRRRPREHCARPIRVERSQRRYLRPRARKGGPHASIMRYTLGREPGVDVHG